MTTKTKSQSKNWQDVRLGEVADFRYGKMPKEKAAEGPYPVFSGYRITGFTDTYNSDENLIVVARGVGGTGDVKISPPQSFVTNLSIIADLADEKIDKQYAFYFFSKGLRYLDSGSAQSQITIQDLTNIPLLLPPLNYQKRIAGVLAAFDEKIENNNRIIKTLEEMAQAIFKEWFVNFRFHGHEKAEFVDSPLGRIPKGWKFEELGELVEITKGISYKGAGLADEGIPMINLGCFKRGGEFSHDNLKFYKGDYRSRHIAKVGDLLLSNTDMTQEREIIGNPALVEEWNGNTEFLFTHHIYLLSPKTGINRTHLYYLMKESAFRERVVGAASGTNVLGLPRQAIDDFEIMVPNQDILRNFEEIAHSIRHQISQAKKENQKLAAMRDLLLPKLMSGEIRV